MIHKYMPGCVSRNHVFVCFLYACIQYLLICSGACPCDAIGISSSYEYGFLGDYVLHSIVNRRRAYVSVAIQDNSTTYYLFYSLNSYTWMISTDFDEDNMVQLNALKALAHVASHPRAREKVTGVKTIERLGELASSDDRLLSRAAETARRIFLWKP